MDKENPNEQNTVDEVLRKIEEKADTGEYLYRGEPEHYQEDPYYGKVSSKLYRDFLERKDFDVEAELFDIEIVQEAMLSAARRFFRKTVPDFEILAEIQHYGGKTNLIDFTTDYLIALFMVCDREESLGKDGRIILQEKELIDPYIAEPYKPINRVIAQKSVFVRHPDGFILPNEDDVINIPADLKKPMRKHLERYHGVLSETVYNDLHGFIKNQDIHLETYVDFYIRVNRGTERGCRKMASKKKLVHYEKAIKHLSRAIERSPGFVEAYVRRGDVYRKMGEFDLAIADHTQATRLTRRPHEAYCGRGLVYAAKGEIDKAIEDLTTAIHRSRSYDWDYPEAYYHRGNAYVAKEEIALAIEDYNIAVKLDPDYTEAYVKRGIAYASIGEIEIAIEDYNSAIRRNLQFADAHYGRGTAYAIKDELDRAIVDFNKAIRLKPDYARFYYSHGHVYGLKREFDMAIADYTKTIELEPEHIGAYIDLGNAYTGQREFDSAIVNYIKAIELNANDAYPYRKLGDVYLLKDDFDSAFTNYSKVIELNPNDVHAYHFRGFAHFRKGNFDLAFADYAKALKLKPDYVQVYYTRARTWLYLQEWEKAKRDLSTAKDKGLNILALFHKSYDGVANFERQNDVKLPEDIAAILTGQERTLPSPVKGTRLQTARKIELILFKDIIAMVPEQETHPSTDLMTENLFY